MQSLRKIMPYSKGDSLHFQTAKKNKETCKPLAKKPQTFYFQSVYYLPYNKDLKTFSRKLRNNSTVGEIILWKKLRAGNMLNYTFNRQKPLKRYIVDFYCKPLNLVIEVDGSYHEEELQKIKDSERQQVLEEMGLNFLQFKEKEVRKNINNVLTVIESYVLSYSEIKR